MNTRRNTKFNDLTGKKFGKLTCLNQGDFCGNHRTWICKCDCGNTHKTLATNLLSNKIKSCGCIGSSFGKNNINWKGYEEISGQYWNSIKTNAKKRKIECLISIEYAWKLFLKQEKKCAISGIELNFSENKKEKSRATSSLDRINSAKGYVEGNVQWVHKDVNKMKMNFNQEYFVNMCKKISSYEKYK